MRDGLSLTILFALHSILYECHKVFYKQLLAWILNGNLFDPYDEFFIGIDENSTASEERSNSASQLTVLSEYSTISSKVCGVD